MAEHQIVQFVHPGFEYHKREHLGGNRDSGVMRWKLGRTEHDRKFMITRGSALDYRTGQFHDSSTMTFWGEWEGPSVFWRVASPGKPLASVIHAPFRPSHPPVSSVQNTDPMVFGDSFIYSNCLQKAFPILRQLSEGSIVLFGRHGRHRGVPRFSLDTCFVVDRAENLKPYPFVAASYGADLVADAVACPLYTEGADKDFIVYFGRAPSENDIEVFSFFPAKPMSITPELFARPELRPRGALHGIVNPKKNQGIKVTPNLTAADRDSMWAEVAKQVSEQGCVLGYAAGPPPTMNLEVARSTSRQKPSPLSA